MATVDGVAAGIVNGKIVESASAASVSGSAKPTGMGSTLDKDAFLQLLVAQMKYQDPLEPQSNTEYISQFAQFSQLEQMQNMSTTFELNRASSYVGQTVTIRTKLSTGEYREVEGKVDFVIYENNKALLSIDGQLYNAADVYASVDAEYKTAYDLAMAFAKALNSLPAIGNISLSDGELIDNLKDGFNSMSGYQQSFIANELLEVLQGYVAKLAELRGEEDDDETPPDETPPEG